MIILGNLFCQIFISDILLQTYKVGVMSNEIVKMVVNKWLACQKVSNSNLFHIYGKMAFVLNYYIE